MKLDGILAFALATMLATGHAATTGAQTKEPGSDKRLVRNGLTIDFRVDPLGSRKDLTANELAEVRFEIRDAATGKPVPGVNPGAWMDMSQVIRGQDGAQQRSCKEKISLYMQGAVGIRPMVDLNSYYVLVMNAESSLTVIDPLVSMAGSTSTLANLTLPSPGADWARSADQKRLYVSTPRAGKIVVVDAEAFKVVKQIAVGVEPVRTALQPDGRYLWIGQDARADAESGVTVIDTETDQVVARVPTGRGHHEIAFSADSRRVYVSNRDAGTVSVIDAATRVLLRTLDTGALPISLAYSSAARALFVADGKDGTVSVYDEASLERRARIALAPGLGPLRFAPDGRHALIVNPAAEKVYVIDSAANEVVQEVEIKGAPFQLAFSRSYAYVRSLGSERVAMIALATIGQGRQPTVQYFAAGAKSPAVAGDLAIADTIATGASDATVFVVNPADNTTYFYMEGMNAPSTNYMTRGGSARAVTLVDRSLKEIEPGVYAGKVRLPAAGRYDVAFTMQTPQILHCFSAEAKASPLAAPVRDVLALEFDEGQREVDAGGTTRLRFRLTDREGKPKTGLNGVKVMAFLAPGRKRAEVAASEVGEGWYQAVLDTRDAGAYYAHVAISTLGIGYERLPFFSFQALVRPATTVAAGR